MLKLFVLAALVAIAAAAPQPGYVASPVAYSTAYSPYSLGYGAAVLPASSQFYGSYGYPSSVAYAGSYKALPYASSYASPFAYSPYALV